MSSNGETNVVLRGVTHGAVDFLIKPVRIEELRNAWQHVVRRRRESVSAFEPAGRNFLSQAHTWGELEDVHVVCTKRCSCSGLRWRCACQCDRRLPYMT